jgi:hypothetical protein
MTQQLPAGLDQAISYMKHQAGKGLDSLAALMQRTAADWERCLEGMTDDQASYKPGARDPDAEGGGEWTAREVLAHFLATTSRVNEHVSEITAGDAETDPFRDRGALEERTAAYRERPLADLRAETARVFQQTEDLVHSLEGNQNLDKQFNHPFFGQLTIPEWLAFQRIHSVDHIGQIDKIKAEDAYPRA